MTSHTWKNEICLGKRWNWNVALAEHSPEGSPGHGLTLYQQFCTDQQCLFCSWGAFCVQSTLPDLWYNFCRGKTENHIVGKQLTCSCFVYNKNKLVLGTWKGGKSAKNGNTQSWWRPQRDLARVGAQYGLKPRVTLSMVFVMYCSSWVCGKEKGAQENGRRKDSIRWFRSSKLSGSQSHFLLVGKKDQDIFYEELSQRNTFVIIFSWSECACLNSTK